MTALLLVWVLVLSGWLLWLTLSRTPGPQGPAGPRGERGPEGRMGPPGPRPAVPVAPDALERVAEEVARHRPTEGAQMLRALAERSIARRQRRAERRVTRRGDH